MDDLWLAQDVELRCPRCGHDFRTALRVIADTARDPQVLALAEAQALNLVVCPTCRHEHLAEVPVLFHDADRCKALVYLPATVDEADAEAIVTGLLARYVRVEESVADLEHLLAPTIYREGDEFLAAVSGFGDLAAGDELHPHLAEALAFVRAIDAGPSVTQLLEAIEDVTDLPQLVGLLNEQPALLEPGTVQALDRLAEAAAAAEQSAVAELLADLAAALRAHSPAEEAEDEDAPSQVRGLLAAGDLESASEFLEPPVRRTGEDARRALLTSTEPELREGFTEHARLFGELLESMLHPSQEAPAEENEDHGLEGFRELLEAPTLDLAVEVLRRHPGLVSRAGVARLRELEEQARDADKEALASHLEMLVHTIYVTAEDEDELERDDAGR